MDFWEDEKAAGITRIVLVKEPMFERFYWPPHSSKILTIEQGQPQGVSSVGNPRQQRGLTRVVWWPTYLLLFGHGVCVQLHVVQNANEQHFPPSHHYFYLWLLDYVYVKSRNITMQDQSSKPCEAILLRSPQILKLFGHVGKQIS